MEECESDSKRRVIHLSNATNRLKNGEEMGSWELLAQVELDGGFD